MLDTHLVQCSLRSRTSNLRGTIHASVKHHSQYIVCIHGATGLYSQKPFQNCSDHTNGRHKRRSQPHRGRDKRNSAIMHVPQKHETEGERRPKRYTPSNFRNPENENLKIVRHINWCAKIHFDIYGVDRFKRDEVVKNQSCLLVFVQLVPQSVSNAHVCYLAPSFDFPLNLPIFRGVNNKMENFFTDLIGLCIGLAERTVQK